ncbi:MAG TPA: hypothetical protein VF341_09110, partial [Anaeromyxobacteraceae bacterium]
MRSVLPLPLMLTCVVAVAAMSGCGPDLGARNPNGDAVVAGSWSDLEQRILVPRCATVACHGGNPPVAFPRLDAGASHEALVGMPSQQLSTMSLVEPGDAERSYLVLKLRGMAGAQGGSGAPMPLADVPLDDLD